MTVLSLLPETKYLPLGENATAMISVLDLCSVVATLNASTLLSLIVLSELLEAKYLPSG
jgi:hypothetical protein